MARSQTIKGAALAFREMLRDGGARPSTFLLGRMRDDADCREEGEASVPMAERVEIALRLVQYELPRLAAIEAEVVRSTKSHEDWIRELATEEAMLEDDSERGTMQ